MEHDDLLALIDELHRLEATDDLDHVHLESTLARLRSHPPAAIQAAVVAHPRTQLTVEARRAAAWRNWSRNLETDDVDVVRPTTLEALLAAVGSSSNLRPLGSGYSCSEASQPDPHAVALDLSGLTAELPLVGLKPGVDATLLRRTEVGVTLADLVRRLDGVALPNLGGFTGQTLAGALSTGTHATGLAHAPLPDMVASVDIVLVDANGAPAVHRFEPTDGITDPTNSPYPLVQSDDDFYAMVVNCGTIGVAYAYTIQVVEPYWVREVIEPFTLETGFPAALARAEAGENLSFTLSPYPDEHGVHPGFLTRFERLSQADVDPAAWANPPVRKDSRAFEAFLAEVIGTRAIGWFLNAFPRLVQTQILKFLAASATGPGNPPFCSIYYEVYPRGTSDDFRATFTEVSVPLDDLQGALTAVLAEVDAARTQGRYRLLVPLAGRFVGSSLHQLSMQFGGPHGTIEAFAVRGTSTEPALLAIQAAANGRPHWGQLLPTGVVDGPRLYPDSWSRFVAARQRWDPRGVFTGPIVRRMGIGPTS